jgi:Helix-turn-helix of DDE superfamily endonuclease
VDEFEALVTPFEAAFLPYMAAWTLQGRGRQSRRYTTYKNCPLPTPADRLLFILVYLKQNPIQTLQGPLFGMRQSKANHWIHVVLPVLRHALRALGDAPCRSVETWRPRLGVEVPLLALTASESEAPAAAAPNTVPLFVLTAPSVPARAPKLPLHRKRAIAARKSGLC